MEGIIVFKSKYGATRQYAEWLGETLQMPVYLPDTLDIAKLKASRPLILGTSVYFGKMLIGSWLRQNLDFLRDKKLFLFVVCGTPAEDRKTTQKIIDDNIPAPIRGRVTIFFSARQSDPSPALLER